MFTRRFQSCLTTCLALSLVASPLVAAPPLQTKPAPSPFKVPPQMKFVPVPKTPPRITLPPATKTIPKFVPPQVTPPKFVTPKFTPPKFVLPANPPRLPPPSSQEAEPRQPLNGNRAGPLPWDWGQADPEVPADPAPDPVPEGAPPPEPGVQDGPTPWDWVAIGLGAAALLRSHEGGACSVGQPIVCHDPVVVQQPVIIERVMTEVPAAPAATNDESVSPASKDASNLSRLEAGKSFELPGKGLGVAAGRVALKIGPVFVECRVDAWGDTGFKATVPPVVLAEAAVAELLAAAADGTPLVRMQVRLVPAGQVAASR